MSEKRPRWTAEQIIEHIEALIMDYDPSYATPNIEELSATDAEIALVVRTILEEIDHDREIMCGGDFIEH